MKPLHTCDGSGFTWLTLPAELGSLERITKFVVDGAVAAELPEKHLGMLELVLEEVVVNVMRYAYPEGTAGTVDVGLSSKTPGVLCVQVRDSGRAFDPLSKEDPNLDLGIGERPIGGLGVFLVKRLTTSVWYERASGMNVLTFQMGGE